MNDRERGICARVKRLRGDLQLSQPACAAALGITLDQLASLEYGRVPLRFALGNWLCTRFDVNQRWLAEGKKPVNYCYFGAPRVLAYTSPQMLFSEAYDKVIKPNIEPHLKELAKQLKCAIEDIKPEVAHEAWPGGIYGLTREMFSFVLNNTLKAFIADVPPDLFGVYYLDICEANRNFRKQHKEGMTVIERLNKGHKK